MGKSAHELHAIFDTQSFDPGFEGAMFRAASGDEQMYPRQLGHRINGEVMAFPFDQPANGDHQGGISGDAIFLLEYFARCRRRMEVLQINAIAEGSNFRSVRAEVNQLLAQGLTNARRATSRTAARPNSLTTGI